MTRIALTLLAILAGECALAQDLSMAYRASGHRAGGPAYLLAPPNPAGLRKAPLVSNIPVYQLGSGHHTGGPARELVSTTGPGELSLEGTIYDPTRIVPFGTARSGQRAGGPHRF